MMIPKDKMATHTPWGTLPWSLNDMEQRIYKYSADWEKPWYEGWWVHEAEEIVKAWAQRTEGVVTDIDGPRWDFVHNEVFSSAWERRSDD